tara:strand:+ start:810 stop:1751 length:942 start_codon:yes stop_codon:yes gene_type:complete
MPFLHPQMQAVLKKSNDLVPSYSLVETPLYIVRENYAKERKFWNEGGPKISVVKDDEVLGPVGQIPIRIFHPNTEIRLPILLYLHGGGYVLGSIDTHNRIMRELSFQSLCVVIGVDYSLSPEQKFPVALDEIGSVLKWLIKKSSSKKNSPYFFDTDKIVVGGDSAGANLSMGIALNFKNCLSGLLLIYGWYGLRDSCSSRIFANKLEGMGEKDLKFYTKSYIRSREDLADFRINVLGADLSGLPPSCIIVSDMDPLLDDSKALAFFLEENGVTFEMHLHKGVLHGFLHYSRMLDASVKGLEQCSEFLKKIFLD